MVIFILKYECVIYIGVYNDFYQKVQDMAMELIGCCLLPHLLHSRLLSGLLRVANRLLQAVASTSLSTGSTTLTFWLTYLPRLLLCRAKNIAFILFSNTLSPRRPTVGTVRRGENCKFPLGACRVMPLTIHLSRGRERWEHNPIRAYWYKETYWSSYCYILQPRIFPLCSFYIWRQREKKDVLHSHVQIQCYKK